MNTLISTDGIISEVSDIVGQAAMQLPSLTHPNDADFLRQQANKTIGAFIRCYMDGATTEERSAFSALQSGNDPVQSGVLLHKSLGKEGSEDRVRAAFGKAREEICAAVTDDYNAFVSTIASQN